MEKELIICSFLQQTRCLYLESKREYLPAMRLKSCKEDVYSGNGLNFLGEKNYIVTTMECYKDILPDFRSGKFARHMHEQFPESSNYFGVMVAIPYWAEATDEFENPTPIDGTTERWKLAVALSCREGPRRRSMTELLFCMLRSGH